MARNILFALLLCALAGLRQPVSAATTGAGNSTASKSAAPAGAAQKTPGDVQIEQAIRVKLAKSKMNADHFTFSVVKGVATIEGSTSVMQHKGAMTRMAKSCGAVAVKNNIRVSDEAKAKLAQSLAKSRGAAGASGSAGTKSSTASEAADAGSSAPASIPRATVVRPK